MIIKALRYCLIGLLIGITATVVILQEDPWIKQRCGDALQEIFARAGNCTISGTTKTINVVQAYIDFTDVRAKPLQGNSWQWRATAMRVSFSWWHLLLYGSLELHIKLQDINGGSDYTQGQLALAEHITAFMRTSPMDIPTSVQGLDFERASVVITDKESLSTYSLAWSSTSRRIGNIFKSQISLANGGVAKAHKPYLDNLDGSLQLDFYTGNKNLEIIAHAALSCQLLCLKDGPTKCYIKGGWEKNSGSFIVDNDDKSLVTTITCQQQQGSMNTHVQGTVPLQYILTVATGTCVKAVDGSCQVSLDIQNGSDKQTVSGTCTAGNMSYAGVPLGLTFCVGISAHDTAWHGEISCAQRGNSCTGTWAYAHDGSGFVELSNVTAMKAAVNSAWSVQPQKCRIKLSKNKDIVTGNYYCQATHDHNNDSVVLQGTLKERDNKLTFEGTLQDVYYKIVGVLSPTVYLQEMFVKNNKSTTLVELSALPQDNNRLKGSVSFEVIKTIITKAYDVDVQGEGVFDVRMLLGDTITTKIQLKNGTIRLPHTYNFIQNFDGVIDINTKERVITLSGLSCYLHRGEIACDEATVMLDSDYAISFAHIPVMMNRCLLNINKDLFANISGRLLMLQQAKGLPSVKGNIVIEQAQLKENILSQVFQKDVGSFASSLLIGSNADMACDIHIATKDPIQVKTSFLETKAKIGLHIKNSLRFPEINGSIDLLSGSLYFPYKLLFITQARISFMSHQFKDPFITLLAKNKIKKYTIGLQVTGSLTNHTIALQSSPFLTEEQIVALLLTGSQEESLNIIMPALIMNNITDLIFGRDHSSSTIDRYFKKFLRPLSRVHVIPSFSDQTARGGLRAAVELDINDRWRALLQKNFSLTEDTRLEVECQLSDDISIRAIRDERRDIGGEVEMRWKF